MLQRYKFVCFAGVCFANAIELLLFPLLLLLAKWLAAISLFFNIAMQIKCHSCEWSAFILCLCAEYCGGRSEGRGWRDVRKTSEAVQIGFEYWEYFICLFMQWIERQLHFFCFCSYKTSIKNIAIYCNGSDQNLPLYDLWRSWSEAGWTFPVARRKAVGAKGKLSVCTTPWFLTGRTRLVGNNLRL